MRVLVKQVFREGDSWFHTGWEQGVDVPGLRKRKVIPHMEDSDPNLPPSGQGWMRLDNASPSTMSFSISPDFEREMVYRLGGSIYPAPLFIACAIDLFLHTRACTRVLPKVLFSRPSIDPLIFFDTLVSTSENGPPSEPDRAHERAPERPEPPRSVYTPAARPAGNPSWWG